MNVCLPLYPTASAGSSCCRSPSSGRPSPCRSRRCAACRCCHCCRGWQPANLQPRQKLQVSRRQIYLAIWAEKKKSAWCCHDFVLICFFFHIRLKHLLELRVQKWLVGNHTCLCQHWWMQLYKFKSFVIHYTCLRLGAAKEKHRKGVMEEMWDKEATEEELN